MYNEFAKQRFLAEYINGDVQRSASTENVISRVFNAMEPIEAECDLDFAQMDLHNMQRAFDAVSGIRRQSAETVYFILKQYIRWCAANGMDGRETFKNIRLDSVEKYRSTAVASPTHLKNSLDAAFPHPELNEIEYVYRASLWLAFIGFDELSAITVRSSDIRLDTMQVEIEGEIDNLVIYAEAVPDLRKACTLTQFIEPRGMNGVVKQREVGDLVLRGKVTSKTMIEFMTTTMRQTINRAFKTATDRYVRECGEVPRNLSLALSHERVYRSGVCYRAYELERIGEDSLSMLYAKAEIELNHKLALGEYTLTVHRTPGKIRSVILKRYTSEYELWKCAFTL